ncbi:MAG: regulatory iron-sulfur-containing complex subunit RicT [Halobacteriovoraceae bacterium]|nr:regulatory iron-sulfur-containing complex subunit RicT [Halobacteriovoraceae bacterium]
MSETMEAVANQTSESKESKDNEDSQDHRFQEGSPLTFIRVRFPGNAKSFPFLIGKRRFAYGQKVVAMSDRGMDVGYINSFPYTVPFDESMLPINTISKLATEEDLKKQRDFIDREKEYERTCLALIEKYQLNMVLTHVELIQFGKKVVFYFNAPARVDFRNLIKDLVNELKMRIELRQISVRDRTAALGAVGVCGLQTCCSSFLKNYGNVSISMAKNQNLALIPSRLNGVCGQLKCCVKYEDKVYTHKRKFLPEVGTFIQTKNGDLGKITRLHILSEKFEMLTDKGYRRLYHVNQYEEDLIPPEDWNFPNTFENIMDETKKLIGEEKVSVIYHEEEQVPSYPVLKEEVKEEEVKEEEVQEEVQEEVKEEEMEIKEKAESKKEDEKDSQGKETDTKEIKKKTNIQEQLEKEKNRKKKKFQRKKHRQRQKRQKKKGR